MRPWFRNSYHYSQRQIHTRHHHKFQGIIQPRGVGSSDIQHRQDILHPVIQCRTVQNAFPAQHFIHVSGNGIDFAIVYHHSVWMRPLPARIGIGAESRVYNTDCRMVIRTIQIGVEQPQLFNQEHALIDDGTAGTGYHIGIRIALFKYHSGNVKLPVKCQPLFTVCRFFDKCLHDVRHAGKCFLSQNGRIHWHLSPAQQFQIFFLQNRFEGFHSSFVFFLGLREEEHSDSVLPFSANLHTHFFGNLGKISVGDLQQNADAVTSLSFCILSGTMFQCFNNAQCTVNHLPVCFAAHIYHGTNSAVFMFKLWIIETLLCIRLLHSVIIHRNDSLLYDSDRMKNKKALTGQGILLSCKRHCFPNSYCVISDICYYFTRFFFPCQ